MKTLWVALLLFLAVVVMVACFPGSESDASVTSTETATTAPTPTVHTQRNTYGPTPGFVSRLKVSSLSFSDEEIASLAISLAEKSKIYEQGDQGQSSSASATAVSANPASGSWGNLSSVDCDGKKMGDVIYQVALEWKAWAEEKGIAVDDGLHAGLALFATESNFRHFQPDGNGGCRAYGNLQGAPAFGLSQIYKPAHPKVDYDQLNRDRSYGIDLGIAVYNGFYKYAGGDFVQAAACYKGFCGAGDTGKNNPAFIGNFMPTYNNKGRNYGGEFVPFSSQVFAFLENLGYGK